MRTSSPLASSPLFTTPLFLIGGIPNPSNFHALFPKGRGDSAAAGKLPGPIRGGCRACTLAPSGHGASSNWQLRRRSAAFRLRGYDRRFDLWGMEASQQPQNYNF